MKKQLQGLIAGILIGILIVTSSVFARQGVAYANLAYNDIKLTFDGKPITPTDANGKPTEPFIIDGTTYLPVRAVAESLGISVQWDAATSTVALSSYAPATGMPSSSDGKLQITKAYDFRRDNTYFTAILMKNIAATPVYPNLRLIYKDAAGGIVGVAEQEENSIAPGQEILFVLHNDLPYASYDCTITAKDKPNHIECLAYLKTQASTVDKKVILQITNTGPHAAEFVEYKILFKKNGQIVDYDWGFCIDTDSEIKPGMTELKEVTTFEAFDSYEIFLTAQADD